MNIINTHEAKTNLSKILSHVAKGKEVVIGKAGVPIARLVPFQGASGKRKGGQLKGKIHISKDFDVLPKNFLKHFTPEA